MGTRPSVRTCLMSQSVVFQVDIITDLKNRVDAYDDCAHIGISSGESAPNEDHGFKEMM